MWNSACLSWQPPFWRSALYACVSRPCALSPCAARQRALRPYALRPYASRQRALRLSAARFAALRRASLRVPSCFPLLVSDDDARDPLRWERAAATDTSALVASRSAAKTTIREAAVRERIIRGFLDPLSRARAGLWHALFSSTTADSGHAGGPFNWTFVRPRSHPCNASSADRLCGAGHLRRLRTTSRAAASPIDVEIPARGHLRASGYTRAGTIRRYRLRSGGVGCDQAVSAAIGRYRLLRPATRRDDR